VFHSRETTMVHGRACWTTSDDDESERRRRQALSWTIDEIQCCTA